MIRQQVEALQDDCDLIVLTGELPDATFPAPAVQVDGLGYAKGSGGEQDSKTVAQSILDAIRSRWPRGCDLLHVHNPTLAKNDHLLDTLHRLKDRGLRLFLQVHDFAEDGRPDVYSSHPYPSGCHWAVLNTRDHQALRNAGLEDDGLHLIPNAVIPIPKPGGPVSPKPFFLYPVRALRRKNIGEAFLLSLFFPKGVALRISLPPHSPKDRHSHQLWMRFAASKGLKAAFDTGVKESLARQAASAAAFMTTSIAEGFGFAFLEPWTVPKPLIGRRIRDVCTDFEQNGIAFDSLYDRIHIPLPWIDASLFLKRWKAGIQRAAAAFEHSVEAVRIHEAFREITEAGQVDFGILDEGFQETVLLQLLSSPENARQLEKMNPHLHSCRISPPDSTVLYANREAVLAYYGKSAYRKRLLDAYNTVMEKPVFHSVRKDVLLSRFFNLKRFSLLKWGHDPR